ncbi:O-antigen ligase family protein, partial [Myxococcota bacterium]|nr:O-antigen ligase family protein [Myxococcota bacterium]
MSRLLLGRGAAAPVPSSEPNSSNSEPAQRLDSPSVSAGSAPVRALAPKASAVYLWAIILFVVLEVARPAGLSNLKLQVVISLCLPAFLAFSKLRWWHPTMTVWVGILMLCILQIPVSYNNYAAYMFARTAYSGVAIALSIAWALQDLRSLRWTIIAWMLAFAYVAIYGITHGGRGPGGFTGDENDLALACCTALPCAFFAFERLKGFVRWVAGALAVIFVLAIIISFSRGGFVGLAGVGLFCFYFSKFKGRNIALGLVAILAFFVFAPQEYIDEIESIQNTDQGTAETRQFLWEAGFNMWKDNPIIGVGGGGSNFLIGRYQPIPEGGGYDAREYIERSWAGTALHSFYVQLLAEFGLAGVFLYGSLAYLHFRGLSRLRREVADRLHPRHPLRRQA